MEKNVKKRLAGLPLYLICFQIAFIVLMGIFCKYNPVKGSEEVPKYYAMWMDIHTMMFVGFGFLMTFLKRYGYSSIGFNFLIAAYVLEWSLIVRGFFTSLEEDHTDASFLISIPNLFVADFCAAAVLISFGAVIGKVSLSQLVVMATIEVVIQTLNEYIGLRYLKAYDVGESMYVHIFGAYFGLTVSKIINNSEVESENEGSNYHSDLFSMVGTLFLWLYWPSFNSVTAVDEGQTRAIVNTLLSITASCITTFIISLLVGKGKINMVHIQNATLAGGVAVGTVADMNIQPFGAMLIGSTAGIVSCFGYQFLTPLLNRLTLHDSCGVNNLHGMPGILSGIAGGIAAAVATRESYDGDRLYTFYPSRIPVLNSLEYNALNISNTEYAEGGLGRTALQQGGFQIAQLALTLGMAIVSGTIAGFVMKLPIIEQVKDEEDYFDDESAWLMPPDYETTKETMQV